MAINGVGVDEPFYFSSSGSNDEAKIEHDGSDFLIDNDTGFTKFGNKSNYLITIDHTNERLGIGVIPSFAIHVERSSPTQLRIKNTSGSEIKLNAAISSCQIGTVSSHELRFYTTNINVGNINPNGDITITAAYTTVIGGTNTDGYIDSTGKFGPLPSFRDAKENIRELINQDTNWIYDIPVKKCDYKDGTLNQITVIAEDAEMIYPGIVRYAPFEITETGPIMINRSEYKNIENIHKLIIPGEEKEIEMDKIVIDTNGNETFETVIKRIRLKPFTTNKSDFIYPLVRELQKLKKEIEKIKLNEVAHSIETLEIKPRDKENIKKKLGLK